MPLNPTSPRAHRFISAALLSLLIFPGVLHAGCLGVSILVKTICEDFVFPLVPGTANQDFNKGVRDHQWSRQGFALERTATIWPGSGDRGIHTFDPVIELTPADKDGVT
jgi:hypothetical protein